MELGAAPKQTGDISKLNRYANIIACNINIPQFLIEFLYLSVFIRKGVFPMSVKQYAAIIESRRHVHASLLPAFDEIAQSCVAIAQGRGTGNAFSSLQSYLDERVIAGGVPRQRRSILLAIHDMAEDKEAPLALQRKALAQLIMLQMLPLPNLTLYRDIATAILRMEVVMRLSAQAPKEWKSEPVLTPASMHHWEALRQWCQSSVQTVSVGLAGFRATLPMLHAPRLSLLALSGMRYHRPSGFRAAIST